MEQRRRALEAWLWALLSDVEVAHTAALTQFLELSAARRALRPAAAAQLTPPPADAAGGDAATPEAATNGSGDAGGASADAGADAGGGEEEGGSGVAPAQAPAAPLAGVGLRAAERAVVRRTLSALQQRCACAAGDLAEALACVRADAAVNRLLAARVDALEHQLAQAMAQAQPARTETDAGGAGAAAAGGGDLAAAAAGNDGRVGGAPHHAHAAGCGVDSGAPGAPASGGAAAAASPRGCGGAAEAAWEALEARAAADAAARDRDDALRLARAAAARAHTADAAAAAARAEAAAAGERCAAEAAALRGERDAALSDARSLRARLDAAFAEVRAAEEAREGERERVAAEAEAGARAGLAARFASSLAEAAALRRRLGECSVESMAAADAALHGAGGERASTPLARLALSDGRVAALSAEAQLLGRTPPPGAQPGDEAAAAAEAGVREALSGALRDSCALHKRCNSLLRAAYGMSGLHEPGAQGGSARRKAWPWDNRACGGHH